MTSESSKGECSEHMRKCTRRLARTQTLVDNVLLYSTAHVLCQASMTVKRN